MSNEDGGPAYPQPMTRHANGDMYHPEIPGMSLRDYFAAAALTGHLSYDVTDKKTSPDVVAMMCYDYADALLAARKAA